MAKVVGIIGTGAMGSMLLRASARFSPGKYRLLAASRSLAAVKILAAEIGQVEIGEAKAIAAEADILIVCVQPQDYLGVVADIAPALSSKAILVSITNGVALHAIASQTSAPVVKVVPSIAHTCGRGISLVMSGPRASDHDVKTVSEFFAAFSRPILIAPEESRAATNITGCGPALLALFASTLARATAKRSTGLDHEMLTLMVTETLSATAALVDERTSLEDIMREAATGGGMTQVALEALETELPALTDSMVQATFARERLLQHATSL
jgi:pyrroline-5-carboxylate reductase